MATSKTNKPSSKSSTINKKSAPAKSFVPTTKAAVWIINRYSDTGRFRRRRHNEYRSVPPVERNVVHLDESGDKLWSGAVWGKRRFAGSGGLRWRRTSRCGSVPTFEWLVVHTSFDTRFNGRAVWQQRRSTDSECVYPLRYG